ncbi:MAG: anti-sigma factor [Bacteroidota bacterium]
MDKKKIIDEGLLELYLLGELGDKEAALVERSLKEDEELQEQYRQLEEDFERMAFENAVDPPAEVKQSLKQALGSEKEEVGVRKLNTTSESSTFQRSRLLVAASLAALFALGSFWLYLRWQTAEDNLQLLQQQTAELQSRINNLEQSYQQTNTRYQQINNPNVVPLVLVGNQLLPESKVIAYLNHATKEVVVNSQGLPSLDAEKVYQMWADVEGEMIDMGLVPTNQQWITLKYIDHAESLNITIEPAGGNDHPTVENLISNVIL